MFIHQLSVERLSVKVGRMVGSCQLHGPAEVRNSVWHVWGILKVTEVIEQEGAALETTEPGHIQ